MGGWGGGGANPPAAPPRRFAPPLLKGGGEKRPHRRTTPPPAAAPLLKRGGRIGSTHLASLGAQRFGRQVFLPVGLEIDAVGRLDLLLLPDRFLREPREARFDFGGQRFALQGLGVLERAREPEAGGGIFVALAHP